MVKYEYELYSHLYVVHVFIIFRAHYTVSVSYIIFKEVLLNEKSAKDERDH